MSKKKKNAPTPIEVDRDVQAIRVHRLASEATFNPDTYMFDDRFKPGKASDFNSVHTIPEMMECLETNKNVESEGVFLEADKAGQYRYRRFKNKAGILEAAKGNSRLKKMREMDSFATDTPQTTAGANAGLVGDDFVPLLGGPFNKQPYLYDYLRAHAYCFHEYHHHPMARAIVHITRDFVLGRGYRVDCDDEGALALWRAFERVNRLDEMMEDIVKEGSGYGENLIWWLPNSEVNIAYNVSPGQEPARGLIPRIRMMDPSSCWEIVTMPEDIRRVLFYWFVFPTQYQIKTGSLGGSQVPTSKFIQQQIPASDMMHFKYNCMSNEKRGRSDLFPVLGYLKWIRDCVNYKLISLKKQSAWTEDIAVEGSQTDVDNLSSSLQQLGQFEPAGSRFIHTSKITRQYMEPKVGQGHDEAMDWGLNMIAAGVQIPVSYFGLTHLGGQTKASAIVGTEPVAKKFERRQQEVKRIIQALWRRFQDRYGVPGAECEVTFPEIITQDRTAKLKDIKFSEDCGYISRATAAPMAAKELDVDSYDYEQEKQEIDQEENPPIEPNLITPLTSPPQAPPGGAPSSAKPTSSPSAVAASPEPAEPSSSAVTKAQRHVLDKQGSR